MDVIYKQAAPTVLKDRGNEKLGKRDVPWQLANGSNSFEKTPIVPAQHVAAPFLTFLLTQR